MRRTIDVVRANLEHAAELARSARPADRAEAEGATGLGMLEVLEAGLRTSVESYTALIDGRVLAMFGVQDLGGGHGFGWLITSDLVDAHPLEFWRRCKVVLHALLRRWQSLSNHIDARHGQAIRWARRLGFELGPVTAWGSSDMPAHPVVITRRALQCALPR